MKIASSQVASAAEPALERRGDLSFARFARPPSVAP